jgi:hypothetical protein
LYLSQTRIWISNIICRCLFCVQWVNVRGDCSSILLISTKWQSPLTYRKFKQCWSTILLISTKWQSPLTYIKSSQIGPCEVPGLISGVFRHFFIYHHFNNNRVTTMVKRWSFFIYHYNLNCTSLKQGAVVYSI